MNKNCWEDWLSQSTAQFLLDNCLQLSNKNWCELNLVDQYMYDHN
jgi:hypothetical protein